MAKKYKSIDYLWLNSTPEAEKFALNQLSNPNSELSQDGIKLCDKIQSFFNKKVFYHLFVPTLAGKKKDLIQNQQSDLCPKCKSHWKLKKPVLCIFDYRCNNCLFLGTENLN